MRVAATILTCAIVFGAAFTGSAIGAEPDAGDGSAAHALAEKFVQAAESAERAEAKKAEQEAARREAERIEQARREAARIKAARIEAERIEAEKRRAAYEAEMLERARAEAQARHEQEKRLAEEKRRAEQARKAAEAAAKRKAEEEAKARLAAEREKARAEAERMARAAEERRKEAARRAEEERKAEAARLAAEVEEKRRAEAERKVEEAKRAEAKRLAEEAAAKRAAEEEDRAAKARAALEAKRLEEARRIAEKFRQAREARERKKQAAEQSTEATRHSLGGPMPPPEAATHSSKRTMTKSEPRSTRATVLLVLEPRTRRLDGRGRPANPVLCLGAGCYISNGPDRAADYMARRKVLGPINTLGRRAGPCRRQLVCTFRNVELGGTSTALQPVDMGFWGHRRHEVHTAHADSTCDVVHGELRCSDPIVADGYRAWVVPEQIAAEAGAEILEEALNEGLPPTRAAKSEDWWAEVQAFPAR